MALDIDSCFADTLFLCVFQIYIYLEFTSRRLNLPLPLPINIANTISRNLFQIYAVEERLWYQLHEILEIMDQAQCPLF
jgi:hypothetical protein